MTSTPPELDRKRSASVTSPRLSAAFGIAALFAITVGLLLDLPLTPVSVVIVGAAALYALRRKFRWNFLLFSLVAIMMFVPARAYSLVGGLPFELEPYRLLWVVGVLLIFWAIFVSRSRPWQPVQFGLGVAAYLLAAMVSFMVNSALLQEQGLVGNAIGAVLSFLILLLPWLLVRQLLDTERVVMQLLTFLVWSGVFVACCAVYEQISHNNILRMYERLFPLTPLVDDLESRTTSGSYRSFASAQHPIALSVTLATLLPIAVWLSKYAAWPKNLINRRIIYGLAMMGLFAGIMAALSRTPMVAMTAMLMMVLILKPRVAGILALGAVPAALLVALLRPRAFEATFLSFLDPQSLIASQYTSPGWAGQGRLADIGPAMMEVAKHPFFGTGLGSRIVVGEDANSFILDNQWLGNLMDMGMFGTAALLFFMLLPVAKLLRFAFAPPSAPRYADLAVAISISTVGYAVAMYFFDAFSFVQSFFVVAFLWAVGAWLLSEARSRIFTDEGTRTSIG